MAGTLYVVATPIGNLEDLTFRAARILSGVQLIAAEDTRRTARLLQHYRIRTRPTSFHAHNERAKLPMLIRRLRAGESIALVSDAGTPTVSDPGWRLVRACIDQQIPVVPVPGPSAVLTALVVSGLPTQSFSFEGFVPSRSKDRVLFLTALKSKKGTLILFETAQRIELTLRDMLTILGDRQICIARELTKHHEHLVRGQISRVLADLKPLRGEITLVVAGAEADWLDQNDHQGSVSDSVLQQEIRQMTNGTVSSKRAVIRILAERHGIPPNELYRRLARG